jgi:hypothetical protein
LSAPQAPRSVPSRSLLVEQIFAPMRSAGGATAGAYVLDNADLTESYKGCVRGVHRLVVLGNASDSFVHLCV